MTNININLSTQQQEQEILKELQADIKEMKALLDEMNDSTVKTNYKAIVESVLSDEQAKSSVYIDDDVVDISYQDLDVADEEEEITFNYYNDGELFATARGFKCKNCGATVEVVEYEEMYSCAICGCVADV